MVDGVTGAGGAGGVLPHGSQQGLPALAHQVVLADHLAIDAALEGLPLALRSLELRGDRLLFLLAGLPGLLRNGSFQHLLVNAAVFSIEEYTFSTAFAIEI